MPIDLTDPLAEELSHALTHLTDYARSNPLIEDPGSLISVVSHGNEHVLDECCPGVAWVRATEMFPSNNFPNPIGGEIRCPPPEWAATIELGIARCVTALPDDHGNLPDPSAVAYDAAVAGYDRSALIQAAVFPIAARYDNRISVSPWLPIETSGGCLGSTINVTFPAPFCLDPSS